MCSDKKLAGSRMAEGANTSRMPDPFSLFLSLLFGVIGLVALRHGKQEGNIPCVLLGLGLMIFPYFVDGWTWILGIGSLLVAAAWRFWDQ